uniref:Uncharacterized protein n=1 Tax=Tanacetum cinerariifolium TaxID=118510 RepID=A0A6L2NYR7_TANCI|nr:hypothetical protein [Tanacetum cinerariifolium]
MLDITRGDRVFNVDFIIVTVSPTTTINIPRGLYNVDVAATFRVSLTTVRDLDMLTKDIKVVKHDELLSGMTNDKRVVVMDALGAICDSIQAKNTNADVIPYKHSSYIAAVGGSRPKPSVAGGSKLDPSISKANFLLLFLENLCKGVNVSIPRKVVETVFLEDGLSIITSQIEDVLKESLTIGVPLIEDMRFTIETVTIKYEWKPPLYNLCKIFEHVHDRYPKNGSIPITIVTPNTGGHSVKQNLRYEQKETTSAPKKGATNLGNASKSSSMKNQPPKDIITSTKEGKITMYNSYAMDYESDEDVENVYDKSANLIHSKIGESSSSFTTATG